MPKSVSETRRRRLAELVKARFGGKQTALSEQIGASLSQIGQWLSGNRNMGEDSARAIEAKLRLEHLWMDYDTHGAKTDADNATPPRWALHLSKAVPLVSWIRASGYDDAADPYPPGVADVWIPSPAKAGPNSYALRVRGDSMFNPTGGNGRSYPQGCLIVVDPGRRLPVSGELVIARIETSPDATFKVYRNEDGRQWLQPLNPAFPCLYEPFIVVGTVLGKWEDA